MLPSKTQIFLTLLLLIGVRTQYPRPMVTPVTTTVATTTTTVSPGGAIGVPVIQPIIGSAPIDCTKVTNSALQPDSSGAGCKCNGNFVWNGTACVGLTPYSTIVTTAIVQNSLNCSVYPRTLGSNGIGCICYSGYVWDSSATSCVINCFLINNTKGPRQGLSGCQCLDGYSWVGNTCMRPIKQVDCTKILRATGSAGEGACTCENGYSWSTSQLGCLEVNQPCYKKVGTIGPIPSDPTRCDCYSGFVWQDGDCRRRCIGQFATSNLNSTHCNCITTAYWSPTLNMCAYSCNNVAGSIGNDPTTGACRCPTNYRKAALACVLSCQDIANSNFRVDPKRRNYCQCVKNFEWDGKTNQCVKRKGLTTGQKVGLGLGIPLGLLALAGLAYCCWTYYDSKRPAQHHAVEQVPVSERNIHHPGKTNPTIVTEPHLVSYREMVYLPNMVSSHKASQPTVVQTSNIGPYTKTHVSTVIEGPHPINIPSTIPTASAAMLPSHSNVAGPTSSYLDQKVGQMYLNAEKGARDITAGVQNFARYSYNNAQEGIREGMRPTRSPRNNSP